MQQRRQSHSWLVLILAALAIPTAALADMTDEVFIAAHEVKYYSGSVPALHDASDGRQVCVTRDSIEKVAEFYAKHKQKEDKLVSFSEGISQGTQLYYHIDNHGKDTLVLLVTIEKIGKPVDLPVFAELAFQVQNGQHTQAELDQLKKEYNGLSRAFYRQVKDAEEKPADEGTLIYSKYGKLAHPEAEKAETHNREHKRAGSEAKNQAKAEDLKKRMLAMQAKGDYAGMMELSQEASKMQEEETGMSQEEMMPGNVDTWDTWVKCLREMKAAAYYTRITYEAHTLPQAQ